MATATESYATMAKNLSKDTDLKVLWPLFKEQHKRNYVGEEDEKRFEHFSKRIAEILEHNEKYERGETTFTMGVNHFADLYEDEAKHYTHGVRH